MPNTYSRKENEPRFVHLLSTAGNNKRGNPLPNNRSGVWKVLKSTKSGVDKTLTVENVKTQEVLTVAEVETHTSSECWAYENMEESNIEARKSWKFKK